MANVADLDFIPLEYRMPEIRAYGMARGLNFRRACGLVRVRLEDGTIGYGEAAGPLEVLAAHFRMARNFLLGTSVFGFEHVAAELRNRFYHFGWQGHMTALLSGISIAFLDAAGKHLGVPAYALLGGRSADSFPLYATTGYFTRDPDNGFERQLQAARDAGFSAVKIKIGASPASDVERARLAREIIGPDALLMVDINGNYTVDVALDSLRRLAPFDIHWCEEPLPPSDVAGYAELHRRSPVALSAGEACHGVQDFKRLIEARGVDIVQPSLTSCGGFAEAKAIASLAAMHNLRVSPSVWGNGIAVAAALHFATSLPVSPHTDNVPFPLIVEHDVGENPLREELLATPLRPRGGRLSLPEGPGLGVALVEEVVERFRVTEGVVPGAQ